MCGWTTVGLFTYLLKGTLVASEFWQLWIMLLWTSGHRFLCGHKFLAPLGNCQGAWLLDRMIRVCVVLQETATLSSKVAAPFWIPINNEWEPPCSTPCIHIYNIFVLEDAFSKVSVSVLISHYFNNRETLFHLYVSYQAKCNIYLFVYVCVFVCPQHLTAAWPTPWRMVVF